jgi:hypothetical protein
LKQNEKNISTIEQEAQEQARIQEKDVDCQRTEGDQGTEGKGQEASDCF